jgi:hypothetical protein
VTCPPDGIAFVAQESTSILEHPQRLAARQKGRIWAAAIANAIDFVAAH